MFNKRSSSRIPFVLTLPVLSPTEGSKYVRAAMSVTAGANTFDPYRNPDRRNGFVVTVKAGGL